MRALVVFESMFGDTKDVADAVARGLAEEMQVQTLEVGTAPGVVDPEIDVLIVGGPTHAFGMSRPGTREDAVKQSEGAGVLSGKLGIREWLATVQVSPSCRWPRSTPASTSRICRARPRTPPSAGCAGWAAPFSRPPRASTWPEPRVRWSTASWIVRPAGAGSCPAARPDPGLRPDSYSPGTSGSSLRVAPCRC